MYIRNGLEPKMIKDSTKSKFVQPPPINLFGFKDEVDQTM